MNCIKKLLMIAAILTLLNGCSAFVVRHTDHQGKTKTYVTETVFVGSGTGLDCIIGPAHWLMGLFYFQPYIHVKGGISYPRFGASGCFGNAYSRGSGLWGYFSLNMPMVSDVSGGSQVMFTDINQKEMSITGASIEVTRVTNRLNLDSK